MKIENLRDLDKLMQLCKKRGVEKLKIDNIEFTIDITPTEAPRAARTTKDINPFDPTSPITEDIKTPDQLSAEQLLFYSSDLQSGTDT